MQGVTGGLSPAAKCARCVCDMGEGEAVEHVVLECVKYARDRNEMIQGNHQSGEDRKGVHGAAAGTVWGDE